MEIECSVTFALKKELKEKENDLIELKEVI
jgi:hypothetical protein